jgi:asparaginyl-tRNA synthetase
MHPLKLESLVDSQYQRLGSEALRHALIVQSEVLLIAGEFLRQRGFVEILPVIMSPVTDPLSHATGQAVVEYYEQRYQLTRSMILHKQIALLAHSRIFAFSPNIRLEPREYAATGRHLAEFTQLDLEVKGATRAEVMALAEDLFIHVFSEVRSRCQPQLAFFGRELQVPARPFKRLGYREALGLYGADFELTLSQRHREPVWIVDMAIEEREFYDREDRERPGTLVDMDLLYPEGFGEALSGGEREHTYEGVLRRIGRAGLAVDDYELYLEFARRGLPPSAGFGIGMERLARFICGLGRIEEVALFPKAPGRASL